MSANCTESTPQTSSVTSVKNVQPAVSYLHIVYSTIAVSSAVNSALRHRSATMPRLGAFWLSVFFIIDPIAVFGFVRPLSTILHQSIILRKSSRTDIPFSTFDYSNKSKKNVSSYEIARNERLLFDKDLEKPTISSESKQVRRRYGGFPRVQRALAHYKKLHGDIQVPFGFVIPDDIHNWPEETWGMNLGSVVKNIRTGLYRSKREDLIKMGFSYDPVNEKYDLAKTALLSYQKLHGDMLVPCKFVIPNESSVWPEETWGLHLGSLVSNIRSGGSYADKRDALIGMGFDFNFRTARYVLVKLALLQYKDLYGNILVPQSFVVPRNDPNWPKDLWDMNLGSIAHGIRGGTRYAERKQELIKIGFHFGPQRAAYGYSLIKTALMHYKSISGKGDMRVPYNFVVPENDERWPEELWGMKLGVLVNNIKGGNYASKRDDLLDIGFSYDPFLSKYAIARKTLLKYKELNGDMLVPRRFVVPEDDERWSRDSMGMKLGSVVYNIRSGSSYADQKDDLLSIGFCFDALQAKYDILKRSLIRYKELYGNMLVPKTFEVPKNSDKWPAELGGMKLGIAVRNVRGVKGSYSDKREELTSLGFVYKLQKSFDYDCVRIAVFKYRELYHGSVRVPAVYNIPENDPWYPEETWGMCLGSMVTRIKHGDKWPDKRYELLGDY